MRTLRGTLCREPWARPTVRDHGPVVFAGRYTLRTEVKLGDAIHEIHDTVELPPGETTTVDVRS